MHSSLELKREVDAIQIPSGDMVKLPQGLKVIITQSLGGTYTVATDFGLARINALDADALGIDPKADKATDASTSSNIPMEASDLEMEVWNQLKNVYDQKSRSTSSISASSMIAAWRTPTARTRRSSR